MAGPSTIDASIWDPSGQVRASAQGSLRADVLRPAVGSLRIMAWATVGITLLLALSSVVWLGTGAPTLLPLGLAAGLSLVMALVTYIKALEARIVTGLGVAWLLLLCLAFGVLRHTGPLDVRESVSVLALGVVPILAFAALVPALPQKAFVIALVASAMDPLSLVFARTQVEWPAVAVSGGIALAVAWMAREISVAVHRLAEGIRQAQRVGGYRLVQRLGIGGMAEVWRAEHRMLARPAAIKLIRPAVLTEHGPLEGERLLRLFAREAQTTAKLSSPHTIILYDFGINREGSFYQVMELLDGLDLQTLVERFGPQPSERTMHLLSQVCHSLREAHAAHFVHRDVKPANIFSCALGGEYDFVKVLDFGLVLDRHPTQGEIEDEQRFVGTPAIMAPEMLRFQAPVDARADIYALGCVGYWLLTGQRVFEATTRADMLVMHAHQRPIPPSKRSGLSIHSGLEALVMECLEKNPNKRPQTAGELMERLGQLEFSAPWTPERRALWWKSNLPSAGQPGAREGDGAAAESAEATWLEPAAAPEPSSPHQSVSRARKRS